VIPDRDVWAAAVLMVKRYGDDALLEAAERADQLLERGRPGRRRKSGPGRMAMIQAGKAAWIRWEDSDDWSVERLVASIYRSMRVLEPPHPE